MIEHAGEEIGAGAAVLLRDGDAQHAQVAETAEQVRRKGVRAVDLVGDRAELAPRERQHGVAQQSVLVGQQDRRSCTRYTALTAATGKRRRVTGEREPATIAATCRMEAALPGPDSAGFADAVPVLALLARHRAAPEFEANRREMEAAVAELRRREARVREGGGARGRGAAPLARQAHRPRAHRAAHRPGDRLPGAEPARRVGDVRRRRAVRRHRHRRRARVRPRGRHRRERRHGQGRHLLPDDREEAPARAGDRRAEPPARASTSSTRAARSCRCRPRSSPTASTSAASSTTRRRCRRRASRRSPP